MVNISDLIPKHKFDTSSIEALKVISEEEVKPILYDLLEWIQDINWPVARKLVYVLPRFHESLVPHILNLLHPEQEDDGWKYFTIIGLLPNMPKTAVEALLPALERIVQSATEQEVAEEVDEVAGEFLNKYYNEKRED